MGFKTTSAKSIDIDIHDNESIRPIHLNIKIKKIKHIFICKKNFQATSFLPGEIQIFVKKGLPNLSFRIGSYFSFFQLCQFFFIVCKQSQVFTITWETSSTVQKECDGTCIVLTHPYYAPGYCQKPSTIYMSYHYTNQIT